MYKTGKSKSRKLRKDTFEKFFNPYKSPNAYNGKRNKRKLPFTLFWDSYRYGTFTKRR